MKAGTYCVGRHDGKGAGRLRDWRFCGLPERPIKFEVSRPSERLTW